MTVIANALMHKRKAIVFQDPLWASIITFREGAFLDLAISNPRRSLGRLLVVLCYLEVGRWVGRLLGRVMGSARERGRAVCRRLEAWSS